MIGYRCIISSLVAAGLMLPAATAAQQRPVTRTLGVALGLSGYHQRDEYLSPVTYRGSVPSTNVLFESRGPSTLWSVQGAYGIGHTNSDALPREVWQHVARVSFTWLRALGPGSAPARGWKFYAGGALSSFGEITEITARDPATDYTYRDGAWYWAHSVDLAGRVELGGNTRGLAVGAKVPALRLVSRPNNGKEYNADNERVTEVWPRALLLGRPQAPWRGTSLLGEAEYRQRLGHWQLRLSYDFTYVSADRPQALGAYMNRVLLGVARPL